MNIRDRFDYIYPLWRYTCTCGIIQNFGVSKYLVVGEPDPRTNDCPQGVGETKVTYPIKFRVSVPVAAGDCLCVPVGLVPTYEGGSMRPEPDHVVNVSETSRMCSLANGESP